MFMPGRETANGTDDNKKVVVRMATPTIKGKVPRIERSKQDRETIVSKVELLLIDGVAEHDAPFHLVVLLLIGSKDEHFRFDMPRLTSTLGVAED